MQLLVGSPHLHDLTWALLEERLKSKESKAARKRKVPKLNPVLKPDSQVSFQVAENDAAVVMRMVAPGVEKDDLWVTRKGDKVYVYCGPSAADLRAALVEHHDWDLAIESLATQRLRRESSHFAETFPDAAPPRLQGTWVVGLPAKRTFEAALPGVALKNGIATITIPKRRQATEDNTFIL